MYTLRTSLLRFSHAQTGMHCVGDNQLVQSLFKFHNLPTVLTAPQALVQVKSSVKEYDVDGEARQVAD